MQPSRDEYTILTIATGYIVATTFSKNRLASHRTPIISFLNLLADVFRPHSLQEFPQRVRVLVIVVHDAHQPTGVAHVFEELALLRPGAVEAGPVGPDIEGFLLQAG